MKSLMQHLSQHWLLVEISMNPCGVLIKGVVTSFSLVHICLSLFFRVVTIVYAYCWSQIYVGKEACHPSHFVQDVGLVPWRLELLCWVPRCCGG